MSADDVLDQADALMRRHRSFVARDSNAPAATESATSETLPDIPVLTEKVDADDTLPLHAELTAALDAELARWLADALPQQVDTLKAQIGEMLLARLAAEIRGALLPRLQATLAEALAHKR